MSGFSIRMKIRDGDLKVQLIRDDDMGGTIEDEDSVSLKDLMKAMREADPWLGGPAPTDGGGE